MEKNMIKSLVFLSVLPLIYIATTLEIALISVLVLVVLSLVVKGLSYVINKFTTERATVYSYLFVAAAMISLTSMILGTYFEFSQLVPVYLSLLLFNVVVIDQGKGYQQLGFKQQIIVLFGALGLLIVIGFLREFLGTGSIGFTAFGMNKVQLFNEIYAIAILKDNSGGFIISGILFAVVNAINFTKEVKADVI